MAMGEASTEAQAANNSNSGTPIIRLEDRAAWKAALRTNRPVLAHLNADTTWLLQLPVPAAHGVPSSSSSTTTTTITTRSRYNILIDPWLQGPQSDVAAWFSTQWHVVAPAVPTLAALAGMLAGQEAGGRVDCVVVSHEFTDHCHEATLRELDGRVPVVATDKAAALVRAWGHFDTVVTAPRFGGGSTETTSYAAWRKEQAQEALADVLPPWLGIGRVITQGNALYYHSAVLIAFDLHNSNNENNEAVLYSPHGIQAADLACVPAAGVRTLALLHGLHDVRIWPAAAQLNLGARNGLRAARASGARYWVATHDEAKRGGGVVSWFLSRTTYSLRDAVEAEEAEEAEEEGEKEEPAGSKRYEFVELGSGDGMLLGPV